MTAGLLDERVVVAQPSLIRAVGLYVAVVVQQVHYHVVYGHDVVERDGEQWWPVTIASFADELGLTFDQMRRGLEAAERAGVLISCQPEKRTSRRKWYRVDRAAVDALVCPNGKSATSKRADSPLPDVADLPLPPISRERKTPARTRASKRATPGTVSTAETGGGGGRKRKTDPRADGLVRTWWERFDPPPLQPWMGAVTVVSKALGAGYTPETITHALVDIEPPLSGGKLDQALTRLHARGRAGKAVGSLDALAVADAANATERYT